MAVGVALLAGGQGRRLGGVAKALLPIDGQTILARQLAVLEPLFDWRVLITAEPELFVGCGWPMEADLRPGRLGPLAGLETALTLAPAGVDAVLLVGCDMPFLQPALVKALRGAIDEGSEESGCDAVVPRVAGEPQPLLACYHKRTLGSVRTALDGGQRALHKLIAGLDVRWWEEDALRAVDPRLLSFVNVNTPAELAAAAALARDLRP
jgi:molybdopterin-guanine dinucleotide biosynthesis protein A